MTTENYADERRVREFPYSVGNKTVGNKFRSKRNTFSEKTAENNADKSWSHKFWDSSRLKFYREIHSSRFL